MVSSTFKSAHQCLDSPLCPLGLSPRLVPGSLVLTLLKGLEFSVWCFTGDGHACDTHLQVAPNQAPEPDAEDHLLMCVRSLQSKQSRSTSEWQLCHWSHPDLGEASPLPESRLHVLYRSRSASETDVFILACHAKFMHAMWKSTRVLKFCCAMISGSCTAHRYTCACMNVRPGQYTNTDHRNDQYWLQFTHNVDPHSIIYSSHTFDGSCDAYVITSPTAVPRKVYLFTLSTSKWR